MPSSSARLPSASVYANGVQVPGVMSVEIEANSFLAANRFQIRASLTASGAAVWSQPDLEIAIDYGLDGLTARMMVGNADRLSIDPIRGEITVEGRDLTSRFISARTDEAFENQTASEVVTLLASRQGLQAAVTATTQPIGRYYQNGHTRTTLDQHARATTEWDLLIRLAEMEGFDVWVDGETLNFAPPNSQNVAALITPADCLSLTLEKSLDLTNSLQVVVKSWDCRGQTLVRQAATVGGDANTAAPASYVVVRPNLTSVAALTLARNIANQMASHGRTIHIDMPGDLTTMPRTMIALSDTGTDFDGSYVVCSVDRSLSVTHGFTQHVQARTPFWTISST